MKIAVKEDSKFFTAFAPKRYKGPEKTGLEEKAREALIKEGTSKLKRAASIRRALLCGFIPGEVWPYIVTCPYVEEERCGIPRISKRKCLEASKEAVVAYEQAGYWTGTKAEMKMLAKAYLFLAKVGGGGRTWPRAMQLRKKIKEYSLEEKVSEMHPFWEISDLEKFSIIRSKSGLKRYVKEYKKEIKEYKKYGETAVKEKWMAYGSCIARAGLWSGKVVKAYKKAGLIGEQAWKKYATVALKAVSGETEYKLFFEELMTKIYKKLGFSQEKIKEFEAEILKPEDKREKAEEVMKSWYTLRRYKRAYELYSEAHLWKEAKGVEKKYEEAIDKEIAAEKERDKHRKPDISEIKRLEREEESKFVSRIFDGMYRDHMDRKYGPLERKVVVRRVRATITSPL